MAKDRIYKNLDALKPVRMLLDEAGSGLLDKTRTIATSSMREVLGAAVGVGAGGALGFAALYGAGTTGLSAAGISSGLAVAGSLVGGGMAAGVFVLAAPGAVLGIVGYAVVSRRNQRKLLEAEEMLFQEASRQRDAVIQQMKEESDANQDRLEYLTALNIRLQEVIKNLEVDLGKQPS
jgi:hypothetical protein